MIIWPKRKREWTFYGLKSGPVNRLVTHILSTNPVNTSSCQHTLSIHCQRTLSIHPVNTPCQQPLSNQQSDCLIVCSLCDWLFVLYGCLISILVYLCLSHQPRCYAPDCEGHFDQTTRWVDGCEVDSWGGKTWAWSSHTSLFSLWAKRWFHINPIILTLSF